MPGWIDYDAVGIERPQGKSPVVLVCEHAGNKIPDRFKGLGLGNELLESHIAWDIGAEGFSRKLSKRLDAPFIFQKYSRLLYDCNRPPSSPSAMPKKSESYIIPGNVAISDDDRDWRINEIYENFSNQLTGLLNIRETLEPMPIIVTIHSFTQNYLNDFRETEVGIIHGKNRVLADHLMAECSFEKSFTAKRNYPYDGRDGVLHTLELHGENRDLLNVMIEIRNDLISDCEGQEKWAEIFSNLLLRAISRIEN